MMNWRMYPAISVLMALFVCVSSRADLVGHWTFDNPQDPVVDLSGYGNHGVLLGNAIHTTDAAVGSGALLFDGDGSYLNIYDCNSVFNGDFTEGKASVAFWVKLASANPSNLKRGLANIGEWASPTLYPFTSGISDATAQLNIFLSYNAAVPVDLADSVVLTNWHHIVVTVDTSDTAAGYKVYRNNTRIGSYPMDGTYGNFLDPVVPRIGASYDVSTNTWYYMDGKVDDVRIYNHTLNETEIGDLYYASDFSGIPAILAQPVSQTVEAGTASVALSITALEAESYQWYKDGQSLPASADYSGQDTDTLTLYDVHIADEGFYHCVVVNSLNFPVSSNVAQLLTRRLVGWWKLDGDLTDSIQDVYPEAVAHHGTSPNSSREYPSGIDGSALQFNSHLNDVVTIDGSAAFYNFHPRGYTISTWVNINAISLRYAFVDKTQIFDDAPTFRGYGLGHTSSRRAVHTLLPEWGTHNSLDAGDPSLTNSTWHLVTGTYDTQTGTGRLYVNGQLRAQAVSDAVPRVTDSDLRFGIEALAGAHPFSGQLDDVRIWSYPLSEREVAFLYGSFEVCESILDADRSGPYGVPDCVVDFYDFAELSANWLDGYTISDLALLAGEWLECSIVPDCAR